MQHSGRRLSSVAVAIATALAGGCTPRALVSRSATERPSQVATPSMTAARTAARRPGPASPSALPGAVVLPAGDRGPLPPRCSALQLQLGLEDPGSPMTGEHFQVYRLRNRGGHPCRLFGYPGVSLYDGRGAAIPFAYQPGAGPYVTHSQPRTVVIAPGHAAFFMMAKYRCDLRAEGYATTVRVFPPASNLSLRGRASTGRGVSSFVYCAARDDMLGRTVYVSPVEPTSDATSIFADPPPR